MATNQLNTTYIDQCITDGNNAVVSLHNLYETMMVTDNDGNKLFKVPINDFFIRYHEELKSSIRLRAVPQSFYYKPKMMSQEVYGTTELWLALLRLNGMRNITEFHYPVIRIYDANNLFGLMNVFFKREGIV